MNQVNISTLAKHKGFLADTQSPWYQWQRPSNPYSYEEVKNKQDRKLNQQGTARELCQLHIGDNV